MDIPVRLGQRVYGVTRNGDIVPTLIEVISLTEKGVTKSAFDEAFDTGLSGVKHTTRMKFTFRVLTSNLPRVFKSFDVAFSNALAVIEDRQTDDTLSVREIEALRLKHARMLMHKHTLQTEIDEISEFQKDDSLGLLANRKKDLWLRQSDFPKFYIEPGTPIWVADTKNWQLMNGIVTEVSYAASFKRKIRYTCGRFACFTVDEVFKTKKGALNYLERMFKSKLPGNLDRKRVPIAQQLTEAERKQQQLLRIQQVADRIAQAGMFKPIP